MARVSIYVSDTNTERNNDLSHFGSHLPATLLASFIKRLSRLSLNAPPAAIVMIIPFTYNVLKRHPALMVMIHRVPDGDDDSNFTGKPSSGDVPPLLFSLNLFSRSIYIQ